MSVPCMLSGKQTGTEFNLLKIFHQARFSTIVRSPNSNHIFKPIRKSMLKNANVFFNNYLRDADIITFMNDDLNRQQKDQKMFSVIQMLGSHSIHGFEQDYMVNLLKPYCKSHSLRNCYEEEGVEYMNNSYDNTIIYTDEILKRAFDLLRDKNAIVFFASDHSEMLGEDGYFLHGIIKPNGEIPSEQYKIPVFVWMSDIYIKNHTDTYHKILKKSKSSTTHVDIYKSIIACHNIEVRNLDLTGHYCE